MYAYRCLIITDFAQQPMSVNRYVDNFFELSRVCQEAILTSPGAVQDDGYAQIDAFMVT